MSVVCCLFRDKTRIWISVYQYFILMYSFTTKILLIFNGIEINPETFWCTWSNMSEQHVKAPNCRSPPYMVRISLCPSHMNKGFKEMFFFYISKTEATAGHQTLTKIIEFSHLFRVSSVCFRMMSVSHLKYAKRPSYESFLL